MTINGGAVTVTGGRFTLNRSGKTVDVIPASIGGGTGGIGGAGGDGGAPKIHLSISRETVGVQRGGIK